MINEKGSLVLRDVVFMMMIVSSVFIFAGLFVSEMAFNYGNTNMTNEWSIKQTNTLANSTFYDTGSDLDNVGDSLNTGIFDLLIGGLKSIGQVMIMIGSVPNTIATLATGTLIDMGISSEVMTPIKFLITGILWIIVIFTVYSAFLQGGKL